MIEPGEPATRPRRTVGFPVKQPMAISKHLESVGDQEAIRPSISRSVTKALAREAERVSVVIPCYNEERFIGKALDNLADQYDPDRYEIIVVDGLSEDRTREVIAAFQRSRPDVTVKVIDNPGRTIPAALNLGIEAARGEIIARLDAHAVASSGYVRRCVEVLRQDGVGAVGMPCEVCPGADHLMAKAIAMAVSHPFGIGDAKYRLRVGAAAQEAVDTVAFACFKKELWREVGRFDEELLTNEDYEFNYRVRRSGKTVLLDRSEHCDYFARTTLRDLCKQYWRYGKWKARMIRRYPRSVKLRHVVAPAFVASLPILLIAGFWLRPAWWLLLIELAAYTFLGLLFAAKLARASGEGVRLILLLPLVFSTIHLSWGSSLLLALIDPG
jgi:succinoglycan biosynthesis protein ExoA